MEDDGVTLGTFQVTVPAHRCRCGHRWIARDALEANPEKPRLCPRCKSAFWDRPRRWTRKGKDVT